MKCYDVLKCHSIWVNAESVKQHHSEAPSVAAVQTHFAQISPILPHSWGDEETPFTTIYIYVSFENRKANG